MRPEALLERNIRAPYAMDQVLSLHQSSQLIVADILRNSSDGHHVDTRKLLQGLQDVSRQFQTKQETSSKEVAHSSATNVSSFHEVTLLHILLCCPCIAGLPPLQVHNVFSILIKDSPRLTNNCFSIVVRGLNMQPIMYPLLSSVPIDATDVFLMDALSQVSTAYSTGLMSFITELCRVLLFKICSGENLNSDIVSLLKSTLSKIAKSSMINSPKKLPYFVLHIFELLKLFLEATCNSIVEKPAVSLICSTLKEVSEVSHVQNSNDACTKYSDTFLDCCIFLSNICEELVEKISVDFWMQCDNIEWSPSLFCCHVQPAPTVSLQNLLSFRAHDILKISQLINISPNEASKFISKNEAKILPSVQAAMLKQKIFFSFLNQVAIDAQLDPDSALTLEEIIKVLESSSDSENCEDVAQKISGERRQKLLKIVVESSSDPDFFSATNTADILLENISILTKSDIDVLLRSFLRYFTELQQPHHWQKVMVELCHKLDEESLRRAVEEVLNQNPVCRDWLNSPLFDGHLTALCNSLSLETIPNVQEAGARATKLCVSKPLWLTCLQKPSSTVERLVQVSLTVTGMEAAVAATLKHLAPVCRASLGPQSVSVLTSALKKNIDTELSPECTSNQKPFVKLFTLLCEPDCLFENDTTGPKSALVITEVMEELLLPQLQWQPANEDDSFTALQNLEIPLLMLQAVFRYQCGEFFSSLSSEEDVIAFVLFLVTCVGKCELLLAPFSSGNSPRTENSDHNGMPATSDGLPLDERVEHVARGSLQAPETPNGDVEPPFENLSSSQVMQVSSCMTVLKELLRQAVQHLSKGESYASSRKLLRKYFKTHPLKYSYSSVVYLTDLLNEAPANDTLRRSPSRKQALLIDWLYTRSDGGSPLNGRFSAMAQWTREDWLLSLCQVLPTASSEDWNALAEVACSIGTTGEARATADSELEARNLMSDALFLMGLQPRANVWFLCSNFTSAIIQLVKRQCEKMDLEEQLKYLCSTFAWWCQRRRLLVFRNRSLSKEEVDEHSQLLLLRLVELLRDLIAVRSFSSARGTQERKRENVSSDISSDNVSTTENNGMKLSNPHSSSTEISGLESGKRAIVESLLHYGKGDESCALVAAQLIGVFSAFS